MSIVLDLLFYGGVVAMGLVVLRRSLLQRRLASMPDSPEGDVDLLDALHNHWVVHSHLHHLTARRMRAELADHFADVRRSGGSTADVVGDDLAAFANDWADSHDAGGPLAGAGWRVVAFAGFIFSLAMLHRLIDLVGDGRAAIGFTMAALMACVFAVPMGIGLPLMSRVAGTKTVRSEGARLVVFTVPAVLFVMVVGGTVRWLLLRSGFDAGPTPGRWWVTAALVPFVWSIALWSSERPGAFGS